jgi:SAM-dependent methyltransferase
MTNQAPNTNILTPDEHPLIFRDSFESIEDRCLHLMHQKAYEEVAQLSDNKMVLDLGCNNGYGAAEIGRHARKVVGLDISRTAIADAKRRFQSENVEFALYDGQKIPFDDGSFDLAASFQVIEHISDTRAYLAEISRILKPGGIAVFTTPNASIRLDPGMKPWNPYHVTEFTAPELARMLESAFSTVEMRGLFAHEHIYKIEYARCQAARLSARRRSTLAGRARQKLQNVVRRLLKVTGARQVPGASTDRRAVTRALPPHELTSDQLFYRTSDLGKALDLMAICRP